MELKISSSVSQIPPSLLFNDGFELSDQTIIPSENVVGSFSPEENKVELFIYDINNSLLDSVYDYNDWTITQNSDTSGLNNTDTLQIDPSKDLTERGYDNGNLYTVYNFINYELSTSPTNLLYISEISSDRTEIKLNSNFISNEDLESTFNDLKSKIDNAEYFDEFYIVSQGNNYNIGVNLLLDTTTEQYSVLIKLYDALPDSFSVKDEVYVTTKVAETQAYEVKFYNDSNLGGEDIQYLRGPNYNLEIKDFINNSTELKSKSELLDAVTTGSNNNLQNILNQKGVKITPNYSYSTFNEFVNFSSAKKRIENFYEKVSQIQSYENDIATINSSITGSTSGSAQVSSSLASANSNIENIIKNFDGYEYYLFYESGSSAYPKVSGSSFPYTLQNTGSTEVLQWLGSDVEGSSTYGGIILSASIFDDNNQNWLYYTIPEFIRDNSDNNNYIEFSNMVGQHFDEIWLYTKAVSEKNNTTNELDKGVPLKMVEDVIKSLGYEGFGNNFNNQNNYIGLTGEEDGSYVPPTGNEIIENYIAINNGTVVNYWSPVYTFLGYVEQLGEKGFPYAIDRVSKEIYKRLYHNMAYLVKKKGTVSGLRQLINIWGIPDTILRINEFGGKNKDNTDDYDYWYNRYSYAFHPSTNQNVASASAIIPWMPLERNRIADNQYIVPDNLQFRFKTTGYPSSSYAGEFFSQSLAVKKSDGDETSTDFDFGIGLFYTGSATGSYSGSNDTTYRNWGIMRFYISGSSSEGGTVVSDDIYLPFYDSGWWSVMLQRDTHPSASVHTTDTTYTLYVKNKTYNGKDRNQISFQGSASISINGSTSSSINEAWNKFGTGSYDGIYLGGSVSGSNIGTHILNTAGKMFSGSFQEFRYYSNDIPETVFNDFVMNPESIEGNNITGSESSFDIVNFRAPLGNELESKFTTSISSSHTESFTSYHPAVSAKSSLLITGSFVNPDGNITSSNYIIQYYESLTTRTFSKPNVEVYFLDQPSIGIRNRISNKIEAKDNNNYGNVLSNQISTEQDYEISRSYTEDITSLEVAFSPQDNLNDDIIQAFGYGVVSDALADPRFISESFDYYPRLKESAEYFFQKYTEGNIYDYVRLIKYIDNSLFKAIKAYVPARTSVSTGIIIKQHMLERNRFTPPSITNKTNIAVTPETGSISSGYNSPFVFENLEVTASINTNEIEGGTGGVVEQFNYSGSALFGQTPITQSYNNTFDTPYGLQTIVEDTQREFYDGEYSGSRVITTTQDIFPNPFKSSPELVGEINFNKNPSVVGVTERNLVTNINDSITPQGVFEVVGDKIKINSSKPLDLKLTFESISGFLGYLSYSYDGSKGDMSIRIRVVSTSRGEILNEVIDRFLAAGSPSSTGIFINSSIFTVQPQETISVFYSSIHPDSSTNPDILMVTETNVKIRVINRWGDVTLDNPPILPYGSFSTEIEDTRYLWLFGISVPYNLDIISSIIARQVQVVPPILVPSGGEPSLSDKITANGNFTLLKPPSSVNSYLVLNEGSSGSEGAYVSFSLSIKEIRDGFNVPITNQTFELRISTLERGVISTTEFSPTSWSERFTVISPEVFIGNNENLSIGIYNQDVLSPGILSEDKKYYGVRSNINSFRAYSPIFDNSDYNAIINNFNLNRPNTFLQDIDYSTNAITPVNLDLIKTNSAVKANTPDSNYTMRRITRPRYEGSRLQSADYNFFTPGDNSFGNTAVIDSYPIYMAHFKSSKENYELWDSYTFNVDALIEIPFEDITGKEETTSIPSILKIDGSNDKLYETSKTFGSGRKALISYDNLISGSIDLNSLPVGSNIIHQGGLEYNLINGSELSKIEFDNSQTYITSSWYTLSDSTGTKTNTITLNPTPLNPYSFYMVTGSNNILSPFSLGDYTNGDLLGHLDNNDMGEIILRGADIQISSSAGSIFDSPPTSQILYSGNSLAILNSLNTAVEKGKYFEYTASPPSSIGGDDYEADLKQVGYIPSLPIDINDKTNYTILNVSSSLEGYFEDFSIPFSIKEGDELRITYNSLSGSSLTPNYITQDFTVLATGNTTGTYGGGFSYQPQTPNVSLTTKLENPNSVSPAGTLPPTINRIYSNRQSGGPGYLGGMYDSLIVTPNPQNLSQPIPEGKIYNFSIRRRIEADDRVIIFQSAPINSEGANTPTGGGYLIPNDLTPQQKRNALTLISQLKGTNTFD